MRTEIIEEEKKEGSGKPTKKIHEKAAEEKGTKAKAKAMVIFQSEIIMEL